MKPASLLKEIKVLYEDDDVAALLKPAGISVHHDGKTNEEVVTDWLIKKYPKVKGVGEPLVLSDGTEVPRPGIVHRLDKETSGVLLAAKTAEAYEHLKAQFKDREVRKTYNAFIYGTLRDERGVVDRPIGRAIGSIRKWACPPLSATTGAGRRATGNKVRGEIREAVTRYKVLKAGQGVSLLELWPQTGRTHQIRVHMQSIGHPVVCDSLYAPTGDKLLGFKRLALHAAKIVFKDLRGKEVEVAAPFPQDFQNAIQQIDPKD